MDYSADRIFAFISGGAGFFVGMSIAVLCSVAEALPSIPFPRSVLRIGNLFGMAVVVISATPIALWTYCVLIALWLGSALIPKRAAAWKTASITGFCFVALALCVHESRYRAVPHIAVTASHPVFVVGDSISAGLARGEITWPALMAKVTGIPVTNLAEPGATILTAVDQLDGIMDPRSLILLEIGGNDMLGDSDAETFTTQLDALLLRVRKKSSTVAMFELPLLPFRNGFGAAQRALAQKYGVILIPKRLMADVFGTKGATSDGLHFTRLGHDLFAESVAVVLRVQ